MPLTPDKTLRLSIEFIFVLLGALVIWLGRRNTFSLTAPDQWLLLSIALIFWEAGLYRPGSIVTTENFTRGLRCSCRSGDACHFARCLFLGRPAALRRRPASALARLAGSVLVFQEKLNLQRHDARYF